MPLWDAVAALQAGRATGLRGEAKTIAAAAFAAVEGSKAYASGACPGIDYQQPYGGTNHLKTLETDANFVRAALLLYAAGGGRHYLDEATRKYASIRHYFWEPASGLYTVYLFDDGRTCTRLPRRTFASVNGAMIWNGLELARATGTGRYGDEALESARAVDALLSDGAGIFADLQAENDVVEPLIEAMLRVARRPDGAFARRWILRNATAARGSRDARGDYGRFFDGRRRADPRPRGKPPAVSRWRSPPLRWHPPPRLRCVRLGRSPLRSNSKQAVRPRRFDSWATLSRSMARSANAAANSGTRAFCSTASRRSTAPASGKTNRARRARCRGRSSSHGAGPRPARIR